MYLILIFQLPNLRIGMIIVNAELEKDVEGGINDAFFKELYLHMTTGSQKESWNALVWITVL